MCVSGGKKCSLFGKLGVLVFLITSILRFANFPLLPTNLGFHCIVSLHGVSLIFGASFCDQVIGLIQGLRKSLGFVCFCNALNKNL